MLHERTLVLPAQALPIIQQFRGKMTLEELEKRTGTSMQKLTGLVQELDGLGLLWGPTSRQLEDQKWSEMMRQGAFPARASRSAGATSEDAREVIDTILEQAEDPELESVPLAILSNQLEYEVGDRLYGAAYHPLIDTDPPDHIILLGGNDNGIGDGVVLSELGFSTPLGTCPADQSIIDPLLARCGDALVADRLDHVANHSIELQLPFLQAIWHTELPVVGVLVPDPLSPPLEDDDKRITLDDFCFIMREVLDTVGGRTLFIGGSNLSHIGPVFGEPVPVDRQRQEDVEEQDRDLLAQYISGESEVFFDALRWNGNPTRWKSVGVMAALLHLAGGDSTSIEMIDYEQYTYQEKAAMVSAATLAFCPPG